jgi:CBS domain containing-hemolysin-like protein
MADAYISYAVLIGAFTVLSAFFSSLETAVVSSSRLKLESLARKGIGSAARSLTLLDKKDETVGMILIGNNIVNIAASAFITYVASVYYAAGEAELLIITGVQAVIFLIACEFFPKIISRSRPETLLGFFSRPAVFFIFILKPVNRVAMIFAAVFKRFLRRDSSENDMIVSREEIDTLFRIGRIEGAIDSERQEFVAEILSLRRVTAFEVRTPTIDIVSIEKNSSMRELVALIDKTRFSRIPVYEDRVDNIIGYIFYRDIILNKKCDNIAELIKKAHYVPATKSILDLYFEMRENSIPAYFVVNEFGAVAGMVTLEDIAEEIVGEIHTRDHSGDDLIIKVSDRKYSIQGNLDIDYFMRFFKIEFKKSGFSTLAGFLMYKMGKIPKKGDRLKYDNFVFVIEEATERQIDRVTLLLPVKLKGRQSSRD